MAIICKKCRKKISLDDEYCQNCGTKITVDTTIYSHDFIIKKDDRRSLGRPEFEKKVREDKIEMEQYGMNGYEYFCYKMNLLGGTFEKIGKKLIKNYLDQNNKK